MDLFETIITYIGLKIGREGRIGCGEGSQFTKSVSTCLLIGDLVFVFWPTWTAD